MTSKICPVCGKEFQHPRNKCCSRDCADIAGTQKRSRKVICICEVCGKSEERSPSHAAHKYCSLECKGIASRTIKPRPCATCGKDFTPPTNHGQQRFCSNVCAGKVRRQAKTKTCSVCGKSFTRRGNRVARYCSKECMGIGYSSPFGHRRPNNFTRSQIKKIKARDGHQCVRCGSTNRLSVDHIIAVGLGGRRELENGQTLCHRCHTQKTTQDIAAIKLLRHGT